jgi:hypothetical protein
MIKKIVALFMYSISVTAIACPLAVPTNDVNFCASFKAVAPCYCTSSGLPASMCQDMNVLYSRMIAVFGSLQKACEYQRYTSTQDCVDNWNCYRLGGIDSRGRICSATRNACA